ncbi:MAG TPA: hypothetical protein VKR21_18845 [Solirubrobacteraceae bacterium]|nr:hypothetical protein [Solirubrobacteraceae bacterium]
MVDAGLGPEFAAYLFIGADHEVNVVERGVAAPEVRAAVRSAGLLPPDRGPRDQACQWVGVVE